MTVLLQILLIVPLAAAIIVALLGTQRTLAIRWISLATTLCCAVIAFVVAVNLAGERAAQASGSAFKAAGTAATNAVVGSNFANNTETGYVPAGFANVEVRRSKTSVISAAAAALSSSVGVEIWSSTCRPGFGGSTNEFWCCITNSKM